MVLAGEASNGREAIERFREMRPDVTLMDLQMPEMDGVAATAAIRAQWSNARIVILTTYRGDAQALRALKAGASGYLLKSLIRTDLLEAIRAVHVGNVHIPREIAAELAAHVTDDVLSPRELEVLKCVASGNSNRLVAMQLCLSEDTIKAHMKSIMSKLGERSYTCRDDRAEARNDRCLSLPSVIRLTEDATLTRLTTNSRWRRQHRR